MFVKLIQFYRYFVSPLLGENCRFYPSCSQYALGALEAHSLPRSLYYIVRRILKCHPFHAGGHDPVPVNRNNEVH